MDQNHGHQIKSAHQERSATSLKLQKLLARLEAVQERDLYHDAMIDLATIIANQQLEIRRLEEKLGS
jgi:hypothetical protein